MRKSLILTGLVLSVTLSGCDNQLFVSPGALRVTSDQVELAVCGEFGAANLAVFLSEPGAFGQSRQIVKDATARDIDDSVIVLSDLPGWDGETLLSGPAETGTAIDVVLQGEGGASTFSTTFEALDGGFPGKQWLRSDGKLAEQPC